MCGSRGHKGRPQEPQRRWTGLGSTRTSAATCSPATEVHQLLDLCRLADLAHGADHGGEGGEDLHRPGSRSNCEPFCLAKDAVDVWQDHWGYRRHLVAFSSRTSCLRSIQIINLGVCQISRKFFQDSDGSLHSKLVFCLT